MRRRYLAPMSSFLPGAKALAEIKITPLKSSSEVCAALSEILMEAVANGGSVSFMHPLAKETADSFWQDSLAAADRGERIVLGAFDGRSWSEPQRCSCCCRQTNRTAPKSPK